MQKRATLVDKLAGEVFSPSKERADAIEGEKDLLMISSLKPG